MVSFKSIKTNILRPLFYFHYKIPLTIIFVFLTAFPIVLHADTNWVDRTIPQGMTFEQLLEYEKEFREKPQETRKPSYVLYSVGSRELFWTQSNDEWKQITAECRYVSNDLYIFVALTDNYSNPIYYSGVNNGYITKNDVNSIAQEYTGINNKVISVFGNPPATGFNGDSHLTLLLLDIDDSYHFGYSGEKIYWGGYFQPTDTWSETDSNSRGVHSNERKIIYIDTYPVIENSWTPDTNHDINQVYRTIAHEFQHLIHYQEDYNEVNWVNEGCSGLAENVCGYELRKPDNFCKKPNDPLTDWNGELIDYEQVALFFLYLYENYGGESTIKQLVSNTYTSKDGINSVLNSNGYAKSFNDIFDDWCVANYISSSIVKGNIYSYQGIDLTDYTFLTTQTYSTYNVNNYNTGFVRHDACEYIKFNNGKPLTLYYWNTLNNDGYLILNQGTSFNFPKFTDASYTFSDFGTSISEIVLLAVAHEDSLEYAYTTSFIDPYEPNNTINNATPITFSNNSWTSGDIDIVWSIDQDWFSFSGKKDDMITITCDVNSNLDAKMVLYNYYTALISKDESSAGGDEKITDYILPSDGEFYIGVGYSENLQKAAKTADINTKYNLTVSITPSAKLLWKVSSNGKVYSSPCLYLNQIIWGAWADNGLFSATTDGVVQLNLSNPWIYSSPCSNPYGTIYTASYDGSIYALINDGTFLWKYKANGEIYSSPALGSDGTIYIGSADSCIYAIKPTGILEWKYLTGASITYSSPSIGVDGTVYVGSDDGYLYALNSDGSFNWKFNSGGIIYSSPSLGNDGTIYVGNWVGNFYALNKDGSVKWSINTNNSIFTSAAIGSDGSVYVGDTIYGEMYSFNSNGAKKWEYKTENYIYSSPAIGSDGAIYFGGYDTYIYSLNNDGTLRWKFKTGDKVVSSPIIDSYGRLFIGSMDGYLYSLESSSPTYDNGPWPMKGHDIYHTGNARNINEGILPPKFITLELPDATENNQYHYSLAVEVPEMAYGHDLFFKILKGPTWLSITHTGELQGKPSNNDTGNYIPLILEVRDKLGLADTLSTSIQVINQLDPPENVKVADIPNDNGHRVKVIWDVSPDDSRGYVSHYKIYRSRSSQLTEPIVLSSFTSPDSLLYWEQLVTILIDSVAVGKTEYIDETILLNGVNYYYWIEAVSSANASEKVPSQGLFSLITSEIPQKYQLFPPYPNPFNNRTKIRYSIPYGVYTNISIYSVTGQCLLTLTNEFHEMGTYNLTWNTEGFSSGIYLCTLKTKDHFETQKMLLLK